MLLQSYRDMILDIVPSTIKGLAKVVKQMDRQAIIETLYGTRVLIQRQEVEKVEEPVRNFAYTKAEFFAVHGRCSRSWKRLRKHFQLSRLSKENRFEQGDSSPSKPGA